MIKTKISVWPGYVGFIWAMMYAVFVRFYQAAGGSIGVPGQFANPEGFFMVSYIAGIIVMFAGFFLLTLVKPWGRKVHPLILLIPTLIGCAFAIAHGVSGIITKALHLAGFITIHFPGWSELDVHSLILWDILVYEPWFIIMGILAGLAGLNYAQASNIPHPVLKRNTILFLILVVLLTTLFVFAIIFDFLKF